MSRLAVAVVLSSYLSAAQDRAKEIGTLLQMRIAFGLRGGDLSYAYELIADCYLRKGNRAMGQFYFGKAVEVDAGNKSAAAKLAGLRK